MHVLFEFFFFGQCQALCVHKESMQLHSDTSNTCSEDGLQVSGSPVGFLTRAEEDDLHNKSHRIESAGSKLN